MTNSAPQGANRVLRGQGITNAERRLNKLAGHSFLSLWSYPGLFRDHGPAKRGGDGAEICDLLVLFGNDVLIFSDKDCAFPDTGNLDHDWARWYRRAVRDSAKQLAGAKRWIEEHPDRVFLDPRCTQVFPLELPGDDARFHLIVVAHGAAERCRGALGGSGSLMLHPSIVGGQHLLPREQGGWPFAVGVVEPLNGFVHVIDDTTMDILLGTLDTVSDFVNYLNKKEALISSGRLISAAGEEELLAYYLAHMDEDGAHGFAIPSDVNGISLLEGLWDRFRISPERKAQLAADAVSYAWDDLIEVFNTHILDDTQYYRTPGSMADQERILRCLAAESRLGRRFLAKRLREVLEVSRSQFRTARVLLPARASGPYYVFLALGRPSASDYDEYREARRGLLGAYCQAVKVLFPEALDIVGIATEPLTDIDAERSEDALYLDARDWSEASQAEAEALKNDLHLLEDTKEFAGTEREYPIAIPQLKGRHRNLPCPCGSGKKYKFCHGK